MSDSNASNAKWSAPKLVPLTAADQSQTGNAPFIFESKVYGTKVGDFSAS